MKDFFIKNNLNRNFKKFEFFKLFIIFNHNINLLLLIKMLLTY